MIPFVAAGGLLIALGFLFGGYQIVNGDPDAEGQSYALNWALNNTLLQPARSPAGHRGPQRRFPRLPRRASSPCSARPRSASWSRPWPATSPTPSPTGPASCPASSSVRCPVTVGAGFLGGLVGGIIAGFAAQVDQPLEAARRRPRTAAGRDHPAAGHADLQRHHGRCPRPTAGRRAHRPGQLPQRPHRRLGDPARDHPRPDDVLRPRRPGQQGGLRLRHHRPDRRSPDGSGSLVIMATVMAAGMVPPLAMALSHGDPAEALHRRPSGTTARPPGCWVPRSSPRAPSRSPRPTRCGSSPR